MLLLDTCVVVDVFRGDAGAIALLDGLEDKPTISVVTVAEVFAGLRSQRAELAARRFWKDCTLLAVSHSIAEAAGGLMRHYRDSHGLVIADALVAATAEQNGLRLATLNVNHFPMFPRLKTAY